MDIVNDWLAVVVFAVLTLIHIIAWWEFNYSAAKESDLGVRDFGSRTLSGTCTLGVTAVSILIPASMIIVQLGSRSGSSLSPDALDSVFRATIWFMVSLTFGLLVAWLIPMYCRSLDVARWRGTGFFYGPQLFALGAGMARLAQGVGITIYG